VFFRDIERIVFILTTILFYVTPIIYSEDMVPAKYKTFLLLNPLSIIMLSWRKLFINGVMDFEAAGIAFLYAIVVLAIGYVIFSRLRWKFAEVL
jgi:lipopolysaccharide transport system permease protein